jgi:hypothetical protein
VGSEPTATRTKNVQEYCALWSFNAAMENGPFIDGVAIKN